MVDVSRLEVHGNGVLKDCVTKKLPDTHRRISCDMACSEQSIGEKGNAKLDSNAAAESDYRSSRAYLTVSSFALKIMSTVRESSAF